MFNTLFKKKLTNQQLANIFVNGIIEVVDRGFGEVKSLIEDDPAFHHSPDLSNAADGHFAMIVIVGNMKLLENAISTDKITAVQPIIYNHLSDMLGMDNREFISYFKEYESLMSRINHPSKVILYGMSKTMFVKYKLNKYQDRFFRSMDTPNPLFLKRMDEIMKNFIWNWDVFFKRYKIN